MSNRAVSWARLAKGRRLGFILFSPIYGPGTHWGKHSSEFPEIENASQYVEIAQSFLVNLLQVF